MIDEPRYEAGMTAYEKRLFIERVQAEQSIFLHSLRTIHSLAENRMLTRVAIARSGGTDEDDADDASVTRL